MRVNQLINEWVIMDAIAGSHAYGLNVATSDVDHRGVFIAPPHLFYGLHAPEQASDEKSDTVYYELKRFMELVNKQNPNIIELFGMPDQCIEKMDNSFKSIVLMKDHLITRKIRDTFGGYAIAQIGKARGLNKKIVNPLDIIKKTPIDFAYIVVEGKTVPMGEWIQSRFLIPLNFGLAALNHVKDGYALYYDTVSGIHGNSTMRGICFDDSNDVHLSSIPKEGVQYEGVMFYNKDAYSRYCRDYKEYWEWVEKRNSARYDKNMEVGKGYDTKNMMHCVRLLRMAEEMLRTGQLNVYRHQDRQELLDIRNGLRDYDELVAYAEGKLKLLDELVPNSPLPAEINTTLVDSMLVDIREQHYSKTYKTTKR